MREHVKIFWRMHLNGVSIMATFNHVMTGDDSKLPLSAADVLNVLDGHCTNRVLLVSVHSLEEIDAARNKLRDLIRALEEKKVAFVERFLKGPKQSGFTRSRDLEQRSSRLLLESSYSRQLDCRF
jgi:hypothetical protein